MPDLPISGLTPLTTPESTDVFPIVNGGITKKTTVQGLGSTIFNQISSSVILPSQTGSFAPTAYYGSFYHTASMLNPSSSGINSMSLSTTDFASGVSISGSNGQKNMIKIANPGLYDMQFSAQLDRTSGGTANDVYIWLRKNGTDVPITNTNFTVGASVAAQGVAAWNWFLSASANDQYQIMWAASDTATRVHYDAAPLYGPAIPSLIVTVNRVG